MFQNTVFVTVLQTQHVTSADVFPGECCESMLNMTFTRVADQPDQLLGSNKAPDWESPSSLQFLPFQNRGCWSVACE